MSAQNAMNIASTVGAKFRQRQIRTDRIFHDATYRARNGTSNANALELYVTERQAK